MTRPTTIDELEDTARNPTLARRGEVGLSPGAHVPALGEKEAGWGGGGRWEAPPELGLEPARWDLILGILHFLYCRSSLDGRLKCIK
jgi:hypothetical protein